MIWLKPACSCVQGDSCICSTWALGQNGPFPSAGVEVAPLVTAPGTSPKPRSKD